MDHEKKSFIIQLREKYFKHKIIIMSLDGKYNYLDGKYMLLVGPAENASSPTILQIEQNVLLYFIYKH